MENVKISNVQGGSRKGGLVGGEVDSRSVTLLFAVHCQRTLKKREKGNIFLKNKKFKFK